MSGSCRKSFCEKQIYIAFFQFREPNLYYRVLNKMINSKYNLFKNWKKCSKLRQKVEKYLLKGISNYVVFTQKFYPFQNVKVKPLQNCHNFSLPVISSYSTHSSLIIVDFNLLIIWVNIVYWQKTRKCLKADRPDIKSQFGHLISVWYLLSYLTSFRLSFIFKILLISQGC